jgi:uncharacterized protein (DUF1778 family)
MRIKEEIDKRNTPWHLVHTISHDRCPKFRADCLFGRMQTVCKRGHAMKRKSETISFRVDENLARLIDESRSVFGTSRGDFVRGVLISHLHQADARMIADQLLELREDVEALRAACAGAQTAQRQALYVVLTVLGQRPVDEAQGIVRRVFGNDA